MSEVLVLKHGDLMVYEKKTFKIWFLRGNEKLHFNGNDGSMCLPINPHSEDIVIAAELMALGNFIGALYYDPQLEVRSLVDPKKKSSETPFVKLIFAAKSKYEKRA